MAAIKLTYFDVPMRAFPIRAALRHAKIPFEDVRIPGKALKELRGEKGYNEKVPLGSLPIIEINGRVEIQSVAITRWAGKKSDLYPTDPDQALIVDAVMETAVDAFGGAPSDPVPEVKKQKREEWASKVLVKYMNYFETKLGDGPFILGKQISVADLWLFMLLDTIASGVFDYVTVSSFEAFPGLMAFYKNMQKNPIVTRGMEKL